VLALKRSKNDISKCFHFHLVLVDNCPYARPARGLHSILICAPWGRNSIQVTLGRVLGIPCRDTIFFVMGVREDATSRGAKHFHRLVPIYINDGGGCSE